MKRTPKPERTERERFIYIKNLRLGEEDAGNLEWLAERWRCSESAAARRAFQEARKREGSE